MSSGSVQDDASTGASTGSGAASSRLDFERTDEKLERRKAELVAAAALQRPEADAMARADLEAFLTRYFQHVAADDLIDWPPVELYEVACGHREFAEVRPIGAPKVRVVSFSSAELAGRTAHTLVEIVTDDMPFLVDSITQALSRHDIAIHLVVHPQFVVRRDIEGRLLDVLGTLDAHEAPAGTVVESWMHIEVARSGDADAEEALRQEMLQVLRDVHDAVEDWPRMRAQACAVAETLVAQPPAPVDAAECGEVAEFMRWLADNHFTFLGYREYRLVDDGGAEALAAVPGTGLGILRSDKPHPRLLRALPPDVREHIRDPQLLIVTKANSRATVHRPVYLDYIGVKVFDEHGVVVGERRFLGLFASSAYVESLLKIPLLRRKAAAVLERSGFPPLSHSGKDLTEILEQHPRDDMFQIALPDLYETAVGVLHLQERRRLRLFVRHDVYGRFISCLVYLPRERYSTKVRLAMQQILLDAFHGTGVDYTLRVADSVLARVHFVVRVERLVDVDREQVERLLVAATRTWEDDFADVMAARLGPDADATALVARYAGGFPEAYKEDFAAARGVDDVEMIERLADTDDLGLALYEPVSDRGGGNVDGSDASLRLKIYRLGAPMSLSAVLPLLQSMGVEVTDERPYGIERRDAEPAWVYDFGLRQGRVADDGPPANPVDTAARAASHQRFHDALEAAWRGRVESDGFQALVLRAGLTWRQVIVLRAYAKYLRQAGGRFSQEYMEAALTANAEIARMIVELFEARLNPASEGDRVSAQQAITARIERALDAVTSLDEDRILRSFVALVAATLRTNYWQTTDAEVKPYLSMKFASELVPDLPMPRPQYEIFVYSPWMEGVHLRFGPVARGGIRYSDRREDFRTEILGLAKTQTVKNAVIVPVGSKGGFVVKRLPDASDRDAQMAEVVACYRTLICGLLDLTDNIHLDATGRRVVAPVGTVRHDGDDAYLVVAADKGTATFSDIANGIAADYGFWLGDAFASGGSAGYDHKAMGITARGAWESVKRHFREVGVNCQTTDFTCVGIGDMSGDVFGNGMLLSPHTRLVAAFDHRHVFVDPTPDAARSFDERARLFALPRSSWADYDPSLISAGGGVWPRTAKSIPVSPQMAAALGIPERPLAPSELMRAILRAPVDLLWNGGIGTYVKAHTEAHADAGDRANDAIRVDARELRCRVVGEGGNLGFTQLGRLEFAVAGGHINTDAIDNSAGVDTSDHEVNIKILLDAAMRSGQLDPAERGELLAAMTDDVAALVLRDNYNQNVALACAAAESAGVLHLDAAYVDALEKSGQLVRALEHLPSEEQVAERRAAGRGLSRPELAVLMAYAKIALTHALVESDVPDEPFAQHVLTSYFPDAVQERFAAAMADHILRREIVATKLANEVVNFSGSTFVHRIAADTGASAADVTRAHVVTRAVFEIDALWSGVEALDDVVPADVQTGLFLALRQILDRSTRWLLRNRRAPLDVDVSVAALRDGVREVLESLPEVLRGDEAVAATGALAGMVEDGVPAELARRVAAFREGLNALTVVDIAAQLAAAPAAVAAVHFAVAELLDLARMNELVTALPRDDRWHALARAAMRDDLVGVHAQLTRDVLTSTDAGDPVDERIDAWSRANAAALSRASTLVREVTADHSADLATLSVALREVRAVQQASSLPAR